MSSSELRIVAFAGSIRRASYNRALLSAAAELAPPSMQIDAVEIGNLPFFNSDVEAQGDPSIVATFKSAIANADGLLIATPEYNDGIPGVLTNAIDWASRLPGRSPLAGKPVALMGASPSQVGTARGQLHLRQILAHAHARTLPPPELLIGRAHERFDSRHRLTDEGARHVLKSMLVRFVGWIGRERAATDFERSAAARTAG